MRGFEAEDFAWSVVEGVLNGGQLLMANVAQVHALGLAEICRSNYAKLRRINNVTQSMA